MTAVQANRWMMVAATVVAMAWSAGGCEPNGSGDRTAGRPLTLKPAWRCAAGGPVAGAAAVSGRCAFVGTTEGQVCAIDLEKGKVVWRYPQQEGQAAGFEAAAVYDQGTVYIGDRRGQLHAIDAATGKRRWVYRTGDKIAGAVNLFTTPDGRKRVVVGSHDEKLHCVEAADGRLVWRSASGSFINARAAIWAGHAVYGGCDGVIWVVRLTDGKAVRQIEVGEPIIGAVAVSGSMVYCGDYGGKVVAADLESGRLAWTYQDRGYEFRSTPAVAGGLVVIGGRDKQVHGIEAATGQARWKFAARDIVDSSPLVVGRRVIVGSDDGRLYMLRLTDGRQVWSYEIGSAITAGAARGGRYVVVGAEDGYVYGFILSGQVGREEGGCEDE